MILRPASISISSTPALSHISRSRLLLATTPRSRCIPHEPQGHRFLSHSLPRRSPGKTPLNHYEVLKLPLHATKADLKRQFYILSKETHPDVNRQDPTAAARFAQISESYAVLADPEKRKRYDRDVMRALQLQQDRQGRQRSGSGSYAGSRPASGLSKRRGVFKGPPPSFYAQGGGTSAGAQHDAYARAQQASGQDHTGGTFNADAYSDDPNSAFDSRPTYKTQTHEDYRRMNRRQAELAAAHAAVEEDNFWVRFIVVSGIIALSVGVGTVILRISSMPTTGGLVRGDGSRRDRAKNDWTKG
jgi:curved DNA-binding protein CbpA